MTVGSPLLGQDERAVASPMALTVSGLVFILAVSVLYAVTVQRANDPLRGAADPGHAAAAGTALDVLTRSDGSGWTPTGAWLDVNAGVGLRSGPIDVLGAERLRSLVAAPLLADNADGRLNLEELRAVLGLEPLGWDVHIRLIPDLPPWTGAPGAAAGAFTNVHYIAPACPSAAPELAVLDDLLSPAAATCETALPCTLTPGLAAAAEIVVVASDLDQTQLGACLSPLLADLLEHATVLVLGSTQGDASWTAGLVAAGHASSSGPLHRRDSGHPLLRSPNVLNPATYTKSASTDILGPAAVWFHPVAFDALGDPILRVSSGGVFSPPTGQLGRMIVMDVVPTDLDWDGLADADLSEASRLLHNALARAQEQLFLDYGGMVPSGVDALGASRYVLVPATSAWADPSLTGLCGAVDCVRATMVVHVIAP